MGRIPENLGQRIVELARLATAMHLDALHLDAVRQADALPQDRCIVLGWDGAALNGSTLNGSSLDGSANGCLDDSSDETNSANAESALESLSSRQRTRMGGAPLGIVMEDAVSGQVDRAARLFGQLPRSAWCLDESAFATESSFEAGMLVWADSDDSNSGDKDGASTVADGAD